MPFPKRAYVGRKPEGRNASGKGKDSMKYEVAYETLQGDCVKCGMIEEKDGKYLASRNSPLKKAFNTFAYALASFELVESLTNGFIASFGVKRID